MKPQDIPMNRMPIDSPYTKVVSDMLAVSSMSQPASTSGQEAKTLLPKPVVQFGNIFDVMKARHMTCHCAVAASAKEEEHSFTFTVCSCQQFMRITE